MYTDNNGFYVGILVFKVPPANTADGNKRRVDCVLPCVSTLVNMPSTTQQRVAQFWIQYFCFDDDMTATNSILDN